MSSLHALWVHGHCGEIEYPDRVNSMVRKGYFLRIEGKPSTTNWLHFAVSTPVIVDDSRMRPIAGFLRYRAEGGASIELLHLYDGEKKIAEDKSPTGTADADGWTRVKILVEPADVLSVSWGIGISVALRFGDTGGQLEFDSAGCDFEFANRLGPHRLQIYTKKALMEFPYHSSLPIDVPSEAIERIVISLHGTGGNADLYLSNGLAAAKAAAATGVDPQALSNTLIVAPQFLNKNEYWRSPSPSILYWDGGRAAGAESVERDLNGDGIPDSGTLSSFTVMDVLLGRLCRRTLFPNLKTVVVAGHSNGGRFMSCYAAASRFEQEIATPRGIHMRYLVMGSGSYLYMNDTRYAFSDNTYLTAAQNEDWRDTVVTLQDFSTVCDETPERFKDWPWGLNVPMVGGTPSFPYAAQVGSDQIRAQFGSRDVHYVVGENDLSASYTDCQERVQGQDTLAKTLLYYHHLEQFYGAGLEHHLHVLAGVGHSGLGEMTSAAGLAALFGP